MRVGTGAQEAVAQGAVAVAVGGASGGRADRMSWMEGEG